MAELSPNLGLNLPVGSDRFDYDKFLRQNFQKLDDKVGKSTTEVLTATEGQTVFTLSNPYALGTDSLSVEVDGVKQALGSGYTETSTTSITFSEPLIAGAKVKVVILGLDQGQDNRFDQIESSLAQKATKAELEMHGVNVTQPPFNISANGTDQTTNFDTVIAYAVANNRKVYVPNGTYVAKINIVSKLYLIGESQDGVIFQNPVGNNDAVMRRKADDNRIESVIIRNCTIDGMMSNGNTAIGLKIDIKGTTSTWKNGGSGKEVSFSNIVIQNCKGHGFYLNDSWEIRVDKVQVMYNDGHGFFADSNTSDSFFKDIIARNNGLTGIKNMGTSTHWTDCKCYVNNILDTTLSGFDISNSSHNTYISCESQENYGNGFYLEQTKKSSLLGCKADSNGFTSSDKTVGGSGVASGFMVKNTDAVSLVGCYVYDFHKSVFGVQLQTYGIRLDGFQSNTTIQISALDQVKNVEYAGTWSYSPSCIVNVNNTIYRGQMKFVDDRVTGTHGITIGKFQMVMDNASSVLQFNNLDDAGAYVSTAIRIDSSSGARIAGTTGKVGFYGTSPISKPTISGSKADGTALTNLLTELQRLGLITNSTT